MKFEAFTPEQKQHAAEMVKKSSLKDVGLVGEEPRAEGGVVREVFGMDSTKKGPSEYPEYPENEKGGPVIDKETAKKAEDWIAKHTPQSEEWTIKE